MIFHRQLNTTILKCNIYHIKICLFLMNDDSATVIQLINLKCTRTSFFFTKFILRFWDIMFWLFSRHIHCCFFANLVFLFRVSNKLDMHIEITHNFPICYESHLPCNHHRHLLLLLLLPTYNIEQLKVTSLANFSFAKFH